MGLPTPGRCCRVPWGQVATAGRGDRTGVPGAAWYVGTVPALGGDGPSGRDGCCLGGMEVGGGWLWRASACVDIGGELGRGMHQRDVGLVGTLWGRLACYGAGRSSVRQGGWWWGRPT